MALNLRSLRIALIVLVLGAAALFCLTHVLPDDGDVPGTDVAADH